MGACKDRFDLFDGEVMPLDVEDVVIISVEPRNNQTTMVAYCIYNSLLDEAVGAIPEVLVTSNGLGPVQA